MPKPKRPKVRGQLKPPSLRTLAGETLGVLAVPRLIAAIPSLADLPRGKGAAVMVLPGFGGGDASTIVLRGLLAALGYTVSGWGLGVNRGNVEATLPKVEAQVEAFAKRTGRKVHLVGWSLGGVFAREVARDRPKLVASVVTMGTPVVGGPKYTRVGAVYSAFGANLDALEARIDERNRRLIKVPVTAIWSRADGIVDWRACIDPYDRDIDHVEVRATHLSLGFDPHVLRIVADRLGAQHP
ncbi:MAG: esterase/lipase family protein [Micropepsaceae bacterium]